MKEDKLKVIEEIYKLEEKLGRRPTKRDSSNLYFLSRRYFKNWNNAMEHAGYEVKSLQKPKIPNMNRNALYYFMGLLITDGHLVIKPNKNYQVKIYTSYFEEKEMIIKLIRLLFGYNPSIRLRKTQFSKNMNYEIYISSKKICEFILNKLKIPSGAKSCSIRVPDFLFKLDNYKIGSFVRGVIDGDGTVLKGHTIKIVSGSKGFLPGIKQLLEILKIKSGKICKEKNNLYVLWICGKLNLLRLRSFLYKNSTNFCYVRKKQIWNQYI